MLPDIATNNFAARETMEVCPKCSALSMGLYIRVRPTGKEWWICASCSEANTVSDANPIKHQRSRRRKKLNNG
jgi:transposase-like protein